MVVNYYAELKQFLQLFAAETVKSELEARSDAEQRERMDATLMRLDSARVMASRYREKLAESQDEVARLVQTSRPVIPDFRATTAANT